MDLVEGRRTECNPTDEHTRPSLTARRAIEEGAQLVLRGQTDQPEAGNVPFGDAGRRSASLMFAPIRNGANVIGVLSIQSYTPNAYDQHSLETLQMLADHCAGALARIRAQEALSDNEEKLRKITTSARDAIIMLDQQGSISLWNEAAERVFGYSGSEALGKDFNALVVPARYCQAHQQGFGHFQATGGGGAVGKTLELCAVRKDGSEIPVELSLSAMMVKGQWHAPLPFS
jgi:two-component system sensor histidine kinase/response regulator